MGVLQEAHIDNDICPHAAEIINFLEDAGPTDLAWGRIGAVAEPGLMSKIIAVDKRISHNLIRPALWSLGLGISIPGQVFLINRDAFNKILPSSDTRFDDLTIGMYSRKFQCSFFRSNLLLGEEQPSLTLRELVLQRARWGRGFAEVYILLRKEKMAR
jgi:cellulose synthase/poly-beta-1,6-N-acetylglucosamine synthase-like glycosyltransferase